MTKFVAGPRTGESMLTCSPNPDEEPRGCDSGDGGGVPSSNNGARLGERVPRHLVLGVLQRVILEGVVYAQGRYRLVLGSNIRAFVPGRVWR